MNKIYYFTLALVSVLTFSGCDEYDENGVLIDNSGNGVDDNLSHNAGSNCLNSGCHNGDNENIKTFSVAGTVFKSDGTIQTNATVFIYVPDTNFLLASIETDDSGNFYTTDAVSGLAQGVSIEVQGVIGTRAMNQNPTVGSCNNCHDGDDQARIIAD